MCRRCRCLSSVLAAMLALPGPLLAADHLVSREEMAARLGASGGERAANRLRVERLLAGPAAAQAALERGVEVATLRAAVATLSDAELSDLAARAEALDTDPVAGGTKALVIVGIVLVVVLAALIVKSCREQGAECVN